MPPKKKPTDMQIAKELVTIALKHLKGFPEKEREARIAEFGRFVSKSRASRPARATSSETSRTRPTRVRARAGNRPQKAFLVAISYRFQHELPQISFLLLNGFVPSLRTHHLPDFFLAGHRQESYSSRGLNRNY
jgi:hypothetical protein